MIGTCGADAMYSTEVAGEDGNPREIDLCYAHAFALKEIAEAKGESIQLTRIKYAATCDALVRRATAAPRNRIPFRDPFNTR